MFARLGPAQPSQGADVIARAAGALGPTPLVGAGYLGIIAAAVLTGGVMITRSHWLAWAAAGAVAASAMGGYVLTRAVPGGFLGDHADVGNWRCPLGIAALSVVAILILLVVLAAWQARARAARVATQPLPEPLMQRTPEYSHRQSG